MDLSIIIPVYNGADFIRNIVEDIITHNKDELSLEVLLIDDGSTDETHIVSEKLVHQHKNVRYFRKANGGCISKKLRNGYCSG